MKPTRIYLSAAVLLLSILVSGCASLTRPEQTGLDQGQLLKPGENLGQTFTANLDGLAAVEIYYFRADDQSGDLQFELLRSPEDTKILAEARVPNTQIIKPGFYLIEFPPLTNSSNQPYYLRLTNSSAGDIKIGMALPNAYLDGSLYKNNQPSAGQLTFRLVYDSRYLLQGILQEILLWLGLLLAAAWLFVLPGWGLLTWLAPAWRGLHWAEKTALSAALSLSLYPLLMLWSHLVRLELGALHAWIPPLLGMAVFAWQLRQEPPRFSRIPKERLWTDVALIFILALIFGVRFWSVRSLAAPLWGDSYQHSLIVQLLLENGGLFTSWQPYAAVDTFTYHFGFHSLTAVFAWLTRLPAEQAVLWNGQILNGLAALAVFPLAKRLKDHPWSGLGGVLVAGLLVSMPMEYTNWGRYTQLTGLVLLPVLIWMIWAFLDSAERKWGNLILTSLVFAGLALSHYRILIFALLFLPVYLLFSTDKKNLRRLVGQTAGLGILAGLLFLPWFINIFGGRILHIFRTQISTPASVVNAWATDLDPVGELTSYLPAWMWLLLALSSAWLIWRRSKAATIVMSWSFLLLLAANPQWLNLPGTGILSNFTVFISAYILAGVLVPAAASDLVETAAPLLDWLRKTTSQGFTRSAPLAMILFFALWGALLRLDDLQPARFALVTQPDQRAADWISANIPAGSRFLVNGFYAFSGSALVGADAGWWLPLLAGRPTILTPLNTSFEQPTNLAENETIQQLIAALQAQTKPTSEVKKLLQSLGVTHIYIGQQQGQVNAASPLLDPQAFDSAPGYELVYRQDRVWIFAVITGSDAR